MRRAKTGDTDLISRVDGCILSSLTSFRGRTETEETGVTKGPQLPGAGAP